MTAHFSANSAPRAGSRRWVAAAAQYSPQVSGRGGAFFGKFGAAGLQRRSGAVFAPVGRGGGRWVAVVPQYAPQVRSCSYFSSREAYSFDSRDLDVIHVTQEHTLGGRRVLGAVRVPGAEKPKSNTDHSRRRLGPEDEVY